MSTFPLVQAATPREEALAASAIRSHRSYEPHVEALCHHSGRYLTRGENNPAMRLFLQEQHDFPGFKELDDLFAHAAHDRQHMHVIWNQAGVEGVAMLVVGAALLGGVGNIARLYEQWGSDRIEFAIIWLLLIVGGIGGLALLLIGWLQLSRRNRIYHRRAQGKPPEVRDFPLLCSYQVDLIERFSLNLDNERREAPELGGQNCALTIKLLPEDLAISLHDQYRQVYGHLREQGVGEFFHAGSVALDHAHTTSFTPDIEYGHRVALRDRVDTAFASGGIATRQAISFVSPYTVRADALYTGSGPERRFGLTMSPELDQHDSYTLLIQCAWEHRAEPIDGWLDECRFTLPDELGKVIHIEHGRIDGPEAIWYNLPIPADGLALRITFQEPIRAHKPTLRGSYRATTNRALSGLSAHPDRIWNALGRRATERTTPAISAKSIITGELIIDTAILAQEHEYVCEDSLHLPQAVDHAMLLEVARVLAAKDVHVQSVTSGIPRIDPHGKYEARRAYWDLVGRTYEEQGQVALDVHLVVSGWMDAVPEQLQESPAMIDVRVRCMHDPRQPRIPARVDVVCRGLKDALQQALVAAA